MRLTAENVILHARETALLAPGLQAHVAPLMPDRLRVAGYSYLTHAMLSYCYVKLLHWDPVSSSPFTQPPHAVTIPCPPSHGPCALLPCMPLPHAVPPGLSWGACPHTDGIGPAVPRAAQGWQTSTCMHTCVAMYYYRALALRWHVASDQHKLPSSAMPPAQAAHGPS